MPIPRPFFIVPLTVAAACRSSAPPSAQRSDPPTASAAASVASPDPCAGIGDGDDTTLVGALERCTHLSLANAPKRVVLPGRDGTFVWLTVRAEDGGASPESDLVARRRMVAWLDTQHHRVAAWSVFDQPETEVSTFRVRAEALSGERVFVDSLQASCPLGYLNPTCPRATERVWLVRGSSLKAAGDYAVSAIEPRGPRDTDPERVFRSTPHYHDDRVDLHDDVTWTWYERRHTEINGPERRATRRAESTWDRVFVLRGDSLQEQPVAPESAPTPHAVSERWPCGACQRE